MRFVDLEKGCVSEEFLIFVVTHDLSGEGLCNLILNELRDLGLDISNLRGQGYDGGANFSGQFRGVQARILTVQPLAFYTHCAAHCLNLSLSKACSVAYIRQALDTIGEIANFVRESSKRSSLMKEKITQMCSHHTKTKLISLCETRWIERHDAFYSLRTFFLQWCHS